MGIIELTAALNSRYSDRTEIQKTAQKTLRTYVVTVFRVIIDYYVCRHTNNTYLNAWMYNSRFIISQLASGPICHSLFQTVSRGKFVFVLAFF